MPSLKHAVAKAYKGTDLYKLRQLLEQESRWKRKVTIATNKLADVRTDINRLANDLANDKLGLTKEESK